METEAEAKLVAARDIKTRIEALERERLRLRCVDIVALRALDERLVLLRLDCAEAYLAASMAARDAGDRERAVDLARFYGEQEYLAKSLRDRLAAG